MTTSADITDPPDAGSGIAQSTVAAADRFSATPPTWSPAVTGRARTTALVCLLAASFMELMDATVVNVALRTMSVDLGASASALQWIVAGYPLAYASGLIFGARLGDRCGRRLLFIIGLGTFGLASLACGFAGSANELVVFRLLQGAAAALMVPQVLTNIQVLYPPTERGRAMGMFTAVVGLAAVTGPVLGALITAGDWWGLGWRPVFLVNVPVAVLAIVAALIYVPETRSRGGSPLTLGSAGLLGISLAAIMLPITLGPENNWPAWGFVMIAAGAAGLLGFGLWQRVVDRRGIEPMVPPALFATTSFRVGLVSFAALFVPAGGFFLVASLHFQLALGWSVLQTGLMWLPFSLAVPLTAGLGATVLAPRYGKHVLSCGAIILMSGMGAMVVAVDSARPIWSISAALVVAGAGFGAVVGSSGLLVLNDVPVTLAGSASGVFNTVQALSVALGASVIGTVYSAAADPTAGFEAAFAMMIALLVVGAALAQFMPEPKHCRD